MHIGQASDRWLLLYERVRLSAMGNDHREAVLWA